METRFIPVVAIEETKLAALIAEEDGGVEVRGAADSACVAETRGHDVDGSDDVRLHRGLALEGAMLAQVVRGQNRTSPGPEIFGGERLPGDLVQVGVDILGTDGVGLTVGVEVLK